MALLLSETEHASTNSARGRTRWSTSRALEGPEKTLEARFLPGAGDIRGCRALTRAWIILEEARAPFYQGCPTPWMRMSERIVVICLRS